MVKKGANPPFTEILSVKRIVTARDRSDAGPPDGRWIVRPVTRAT